MENKFNGPMQKLDIGGICENGGIYAPVVNGGLKAGE